jgi:hypothetical protein
MAQAFDFALEKIGMDIYAYTIWNDYVTFLKSVYVINILSKIELIVVFIFKGKRLVRMLKIRKSLLFGKSIRKVL